MQSTFFSRLKIAAICFLLASVFMLFGCSPQNGPKEQIDYADDEIISVLGNALEKRFAIANSKPTSGSTLKSVTEIELDALKPFSSRQLEDTKLQECTLSYINLLETMNEAAAIYDEDYVEATRKWNDCQYERSQLIKTFVDNYGLTVGEAYEKDLNDIVFRGNLAAQKKSNEEALNKLASNLVFEKGSKHGLCSYSCIAENTTGLDIKEVVFILSLYDKNGTRIGETSAHATDWSQKEKVRLEAISDISAADVKVKIDYYEFN